MADTKIALDAIGKTVQTNLSKDENKRIFLTTIDKHMARNSSIYAANAPGARPIFTTDENEAVIKALGLNTEDLRILIKRLQKNDSRWKIQGVNHPFLLADVMALRYSSLKKDNKMIVAGNSYIIAFQYPLLHYKYFKKCDPNPAVMNYVVNNLSNKYKLKQFGNLWEALYDIIDGAYRFHKAKIEAGTDDGLVRFLTDSRTRLNGFMRAISNEYYPAFNEGKYLGTEAESFEDDKYHEANSNVLEVETITNKVVTKLITIGPNKAIIKLVAEACEVSEPKLRSYIMSMVTNSHITDIKKIIENLLFMYLVNSEEHHTPDQVYTNDFTVYCLKVYKKSITVDKNVVEIKNILNRWLVDLGIQKKGVAMTTFAANYRKALYMFFVLSVVDSK